MIREQSGNLLSADVEALVNAVNTVGVIEVAAGISQRCQQLREFRVDEDPVAAGLHVPQHPGRGEPAQPAGCHGARHIATFHDGRDADLVTTSNLPHPS